VRLAVAGATPVLVRPAPDGPAYERRTFLTVHSPDGYLTAPASKIFDNLGDTWTARGSVPSLSVVVAQRNAQTDASDAPDAGQGVQPRLGQKLSHGAEFAFPPDE
jgi:hypothetical protein